MILCFPSGVLSTTATAMGSWGSFCAASMAGAEDSMELYSELIAPRAVMDVKGSGAKAPRQPMMKRSTSSLEAAELVRNRGSS